MEISIQTKRLTIRRLLPEDAAALYFYRKDKAANKYQGWIPESLKDAIDFISNKVSPEINIPGTWFQFAVELKEANTLIGDLGVHFNKDFDNKAEIGYTIDKHFQSCGYAQEAVSTLIDYLFNSLNKSFIEAVTDPENEKSIKLLKKLGFTELPETKEYIMGGQKYNDKVFELTKSSFKMED